VSELRELLARGLEGIRPRAQDPLAVTMRRVQARRRRRRAGAAALAGLAVIGFALAWIKVASGPQPGPVLTGPTPALANYELTPDSVQAQGPAQIVVHFTYAWTTAEFPGTHRCTVLARSAAGTIVGSRTFEFEALESSGQDSVALSVDGAVATVTLSCDPTQIGAPGEGRYVFGNVHTEPRLGGFVVLYDLRWSGPPPAPTLRCIATATLGGEIVASQPVTEAVLRADAIPLLFSAGTLERPLTDEEVAALQITFDCPAPD
jgi:hypothetical protein